jgi:hypothetical protein
MNTQQDATIKDQVIRGLRKLHNEELNNFNSSPNVMRIIRSMEIVWEEHLSPGRDEQFIRKT